MKCSVCDQREARFVVPSTFTRVCGDACYQRYWHELDDTRRRAIVQLNSVRRYHETLLPSSNKFALRIGVRQRHPLAEKCDHLIGAEVIASAPEVCSLQSLRDHMEDAALAEYSTDGRFIVAGVFDGHGGNFASRNFLASPLKREDRAYSTFIEDIVGLSRAIETNQSSLGQVESQFEPVLNDELRSALYGTTREVPGDRLQRFKSALRDLFLLKDAQLRKAESDASTKSGSTASVATVLADDAGIDHLVVAHVGDSSAIYFDDQGKILYSTRDHEPSLREERERIESAGGSIRIYEEEKHMSFHAGQEISHGKMSRIVDEKGHATVNMSRAFGDFHVKKRRIAETGRVVDDLTGVRGWLSVEPDIESLPLVTDRRSFLVIASDGMWNFFLRGWIGAPDNEVHASVAAALLQFVNVHANDRRATAGSCQRLLHTSLRNQESLGIGDNTTVMVVEFTPKNR